MTSSVNEEEIINLVKNKRFLWDSKDPDYKNISLKTEEFAQIGTHFNLSGEEVRRKWRSLRSGFRRELLARSNKKPKPKTKQWKHFSKLLFLRDSESGRDGLSDNEFDDNHQNNSSLCINQQQDNVSTEDFSDLMHINSPVPNLSVEHVTDEYKFNLIPAHPTNAPTDKPDKNCQEVNDNTQFKLLPPNHLNPTIQPQQIYFVKTNGMSDMSQLVLIKKPDQNSATTAQITNHHQEEPHHHAVVEQQPQPQLTTIKSTASAPIVNRTNDLLINSFKSNNTQSNGNSCMTVAPKAKKRKEESEEDLYADDYFGRMVASLMKSIDPAERMPVRLAILKLIDDWKKTNENNK